MKIEHFMLSERNDGSIMHGYLVTGDGVCEAVSSEQSPVMVQLNDDLQQSLIDQATQCAKRRYEENNRQTFRLSAPTGGKKVGILEELGIDENPAPARGVLG